MLHDLSTDISRDDHLDVQLFSTPSIDILIMLFLLISWVFYQYSLKYVAVINLLVYDGFLVSFPRLTTQDDSGNQDTSNADIINTLHVILSELSPES